MDGTESSDAESAAESDDPDSHGDDSSWVASRTTIQPPEGKRPRTTRPMDDPKVSNSSGLVCQRSGSAGVGSLLVCRLHAALSDDVKTLVHMLTSCLADSPSRTPSPLCTPVRPTTQNSFLSDGSASDREQIPKRRWRGQIHIGNEPGESHVGKGTKMTISKFFAPGLLVSSVLFA